MARAPAQRLPFGPVAGQSLAVLLVRLAVTTLRAGEVVHLSRVHYVHASADLMEPFGDRLMIDPGRFQVDVQVRGRLAGVLREPADQTGVVIWLIGEHLGFDFALISEPAHIQFLLADINPDMSHFSTSPCLCSLTSRWKGLGYRSSLRRAAWWDQSTKQVQRP